MLNIDIFVPSKLGKPNIVKNFKQKKGKIWSDIIGFIEKVIFYAIVNNKKGG